MAQTNRTYGVCLYALNSTNTNLNIYSGFETIVLDNVSIPTITNFSIAIKNNSITGNVTIVNVYGSPNGIDYILLKSNVFNTSIAASTMRYEEFNMLALFARVTVQSDSNIAIDAYLQGSLT